jgi:hypothetical protein
MRGFGLTVNSTNLRHTAKECFVTKKQTQAMFKCYILNKDVFRLTKGHVKLKTTTATGGTTVT